MKSLVALWLGVEGLTDQPAAIGHTEGWSAIARGLCGLETSDATLREGSRLKAGGFRSGRGVPLAHAPVLSDPSVEEGGDVGPFGIVALGWTGISVRALNDVLTLEIDGAVKAPPCLARGCTSRGRSPKVPRRGAPGRYAVLEGCVVHKRSRLLFVWGLRRAYSL